MEEITITKIACNLAYIVKTGCMEILWHMGNNVSPILSMLIAARNIN